MACVTVGFKRPLDLDGVLSPTSAGSPKRRRIISLYPGMPSARPEVLEGEAATNRPSPFGEVEGRLTAEDVSDNIRDEIKRLQRRKNNVVSPVASPSASAAGADQMMCMSPPHPGMDNQDQFQATPKSVTAVMNEDVPLFTAEQAKNICDRLLHDCDVAMRSQFDRTLNAKLAEQYESFVKFTYDQIQKQFEGSSQPSYLS